MANEFKRLLIDTGKGCPIQYSVGEADQAIRKKFNEVLGTDENSTVKERRRAYRMHKNEVFAIIEDVIDELLVSGWTDNPFFRDFVEVKNLADGDKNEFYVPDKSILTLSKFSGNHHDIIRQKLGMGSSFSLTTSWYGIKIYEEFERFMAGRIDWPAFVQKLYEAVDRKINDMLYQAFLGLDEIVPAAYTFSGDITEATLLNRVEMVETANGGKEVVIAGPRTALSKITALTNATMWSSEMKNERNTTGQLGVWNGIRLMRVPQVFELNTRTFAYPENKFYVLPMTDNKPIKLVYEGDSYFTESTDYTARKDMTIEAEYMTKFGIGTIFGADFCTGEMA